MQPRPSRSKTPPLSAAVLLAAAFLACAAARETLAHDDAYAGRAPVVINGLLFKGKTLKASDRTDPELDKILRKEVRGQDAEDGAVRYSLYWYDLDGDGTPEALVEIDEASNCGSGGCFLDVYRLNQAGEYEAVGGIFGRAPYVISTKHKSRGWSDLVMYGRGVNHDDGDGYYRVMYDGEKYDSDKNAERYPEGTVVHGVRLADDGPVLKISRAGEPKATR